MRPNRVAGAILALSVIAQMSLAHAGDRNLLGPRYPVDSLMVMLTAPGKWNPWPAVANRTAWEKIPESVRRAHIQEGEKHLGAPWQQLPATLILDFVRTGNRSRFQDIQFARRKQLADLVLAEIFENRGRFVDDIANGVWAFCEETYWGVPAHLNLQRHGFGLPDITEPTVDLFVAETGSLLAWIHHFLGPQLDAVSPLLRERIRYEIDRRILTPNLERTDFWWMNVEVDSVINNWNPWVNSNWLTCLLLLEDDRDRQVAAIRKIMRSLDAFINVYPDDGGCDEGPIYWTRAAASLFDCLETLHSATGGYVDLFAHPLIREMGRYIYRAHIDSDFFTNFADARPRLTMPPALIFSYGRRIGDDQMVRFAAFTAKQQNYGTGYLPERFGRLNRQLPALFLLREMAAVEPEAPLLRDVWLPETQLMAARARQGSSAGLYLTAKAGHNQENHNHNDVGSFMVYLDGKPVLIDVGSATYTKKTFGPERYTLWNMQSAYHNLPTINGSMQSFGRKYRARDVSHRANDDEAELSLDLAAAYPVEAGVRSWRRSLKLVRGNRVALRESWQLDRMDAPFELHFMTALKVSAAGADELILSASDKETPRQRGVVMRFDPDQFVVRLDAILLDDDRLIANWGPELTRITLVSRSRNLSGQHEIIMEEKM